MSVRRKAALRALFWLVAAAAAAQTPTVRVTTRLVDVSVIARDAKGPVADLAADDFAVFDNGVERKIAFFSIQKVEPPPKRLAPPSPHVFTNRADLRTDAASRLTVILIDGLNTEFESQAAARQQLLKFIHEIQPRDRMAIYAMGDRLRKIQDFTNDIDQLAAAVEHYTPNLRLSPDSPAPLGVRSAGGEYAAAADATIKATMDYYRALSTHDLVKDLADEMARIPGRKSLIWLSSGFPLEYRVPGPGREEPVRFDPVTNRLGRALAKGDLAVYPVDTRGLSLSGGASEQERHYGMDLIARLTGGRAFYDRNDTAGEIREAIDDARVTYTLGFYPDSAGQDGNYHRLQIEVRRKGIDLQYRGGYLAADAQIPASERDGRTEIRDALWSPIDATGIAVTVRLEKPDPKHSEGLRMTIAIPGRDLSLEPQGGGWLGTLDLVVAQRAADGRDLMTVGEAVQVNPNRQRYETLLRDGLLLRREIRLAPGASRLRVVVYDRGSGRLGSLDFPAAAPL
jgi:VWFA-related protein